MALSAQLHMDRKEDLLAFAVSVSEDCKEYSSDFHSTYVVVL